MATPQKYISVTCQASEGGVHPCSLRYWAPSQCLNERPIILWELRRLGDAANLLGQKYVHKWVASEKRKGHWAALWALSGCIMTVVASRKSCDANGVSARGQPVQDEWTVENSALIVLLAMWSGSGNTSAGLILQTLLRATLTIAALDVLVEQLRASLAWSLCQFRPQDGRCGHLQHVLAPPPWQEGMDVEQKYVSYVRVCTALVFYLKECSTCQQLWPLVLQALSAAVVSGLELVSHADAIHDSTLDPSKSKRRRISEDVLAAVASQSATHHISLGGVASVHEVAGRSTCSRYHESVVSRNLASAWQMATEMFICGIALDCKRLGNPAEELCCYFFQNPDGASATWLPFQVDRPRCR